MSTAGLRSANPTSRGRHGAEVLDGNGGYDVAHYDLNFHYDPGSDMLRGLAKLDITAKQDLSRFNLDLVGMNVHAILVDGRPAR